jgi:hypothetical protein
MRKFLSVCTALFALVTPVVAMPQISTAMQAHRDLAAVRAATAKYHDVNVAIANG